jgi:exopolyphosphatase / guanosine-5'-triphosphate,3'-diphosphate pyrophosphatase
MNAGRHAYASAPFEWGSLDSPATSRIGVVDVGSNSVRLVVFDGIARSPSYFYNEKVLCGLGENIHETGVLNPRGRARALAALHRFVALARLMKLTRLQGVATAAVREADDGPDFCAQVLAETGLDLHVASGEEEAELSAKGVLLGWPHANGIVCDIGGASMELARVDEGVIGRRRSSRLGPMQLANLGSDDAIEAEIERVLAKLRKKMPEPVHNLFLVGGSWRAIARLDMERRDYPLHVLHEYHLSPEQIIDTAHWATTKTPEDFASIVDISTERLNLVPLAARVLERLVAVFKPEHVLVSSYGIREGMLYNAMSETLRSQDPLLEAARQREQVSARFPGFADRLDAWLQPLYATASDAEKRLVKAACYLHDITWRAHPDYRAEVCFESVTRANLSGVDHEGRIFLGLSILHRYKSSARTRFDEKLLNLLPQDRQDKAATLGKAMRLGAMLSGAVAAGLEQTELTVEDDTVTLHLHGDARELLGEAVVRRVDALASSMGRSGRVVQSED